MVAEWRISLDETPREDGSFETILIISSWIKSVEICRIQASETKRGWKPWNNSDLLVFDKTETEWNLWNQFDTQASNETSKRGWKLWNTSSPIWSNWDREKSVESPQLLLNLFYIQAFHEAFKRGWNLWNTYDLLNLYWTCFTSDLQEMLNYLWSCLKTSIESVLHPRLW